jgi:signal peptidase II
MPETDQVTQSQGSRTRMVSGFGIASAVLALAAVGVTTFLVWWLRSVKDLRLAAAIGLIIGGALGNVVDRIAYGAVADFFLLHAFGYNWYVFNIADVAVVGGVALMALDLFLNEYRTWFRGSSEDHS